MIQVYAIYVKNLPDPKSCPECMEGLEKKRKEKIVCYKQENDRKLSLGAGILLREVFAQRKFSIKDIQYGVNGKPEADGFYFNLSHSSEIVICAVGDSTVGCDVEKVTEYKDKVIQRFFTEKEIQYFQGLDDTQKKEEFFRLWTMKESYMKMTGEGMSLSPKRFEFLFGDSVSVYRDGKKCSCYVKEYDLPGYKASVCSEKNVFAEKLNFIM